MMQSWIFSIVTVTWSFRNHSNMLICCLRNISHYNQCNKQLHYLIFCGNGSSVKRKLKRTAFIWNQNCFVTLNYFLSLLINLKHRFELKYLKKNFKIVLFANCFQKDCLNDFSGMSSQLTTSTSSLKVYFFFLFFFWSPVRIASVFSFVSYFGYKCLLNKYVNANLWVTSICRNVLPSDP